MSITRKKQPTYKQLIVSHKTLFERGLSIREQYYGPEHVEVATAQIDWLKQFPIKEMQKRGWLQHCDETTEALMIAVLNFFGVATPGQWQRGWTKRRLAFRKSMHIKADIGAISVWLRQGEIIGGKILCRPFNKA